MCNLSDIIEERGIERGVEKGIKKGRFDVLTGLVRDGLLSMKDAAERLGLPEEELEKLMQDK